MPTVPRSGTAGASARVASTATANRTTDSSGTLSAEEVTCHRCVLCGQRDVPNQAAAKVMATIATTEPTI